MKRILIVDDSKNWLDYHSYAIKELFPDYQIETADSAHAGIAKITANIDNPYDIVITDYYLRISENKCYSSNNVDSEITACSKILKDNPDTTINSEFVQEYGTLYEHTFKKNSSGTNYWYSSNLK